MAEGCRCALAAGAREQAGHGLVPLRRYSFIASRSWVRSEALAGSPRPPSERQVERENCHLPRYMPPLDTARGLPPDSHSAIALMIRGSRTLLEDLRSWVTSRRLNAPRRRARRVLGPTTPSTSRPLRRWNRLTAAWVWEPKMPSALMRSLRWILTTARPKSPLRTTVVWWLALAPVPPLEDPFNGSSAAAGPARASESAGTASNASPLFIPTGPNSLSYAPTG